MKEITSWKQSWTIHCLYDFVNYDKESVMFCNNYITKLQKPNLAAPYVPRGYSCELRLLSSSAEFELWLQYRIMIVPLLSQDYQPGC